MAGGFKSFLWLWLGRAAAGRDRWPSAFRNFRVFMKSELRAPIARAKSALANTWAVPKSDMDNISSGAKSMIAGLRARSKSEIRNVRAIPGG